MPHDQRMKMIMKIDQVTHVSELAEFMAGTQAIVFCISKDKDARYSFIEKLLKQIHYAKLSRPDKGIVIAFLQHTTQYSRQQITRLIARYRAQGRLKRRQSTSNGFTTRYTKADIECLAELDTLHDTPNGARIKKLCERAYEVFGDLRYQRLATISISHLYNLRRHKVYQHKRVYVSKTQSPKGVSIGERRKPNNQGRPGYMRIDTVHQGDLDGEKGVYHINAVDEITQFEVVVSVEKISENHLVPALELLLAQLPFKLINFHSDNGSEYVNKHVAKLLNKLQAEFTKSRPRTSNDNALAEGKNAAVVRKIFGHSHIPQRHASRINEFNLVVLNPYVNFHRPCYFPTEKINDKGKVIKQYHYRDMMTPYDKLISLPGWQTYLKDDWSEKKLRDLAMKMTDNEAATLLQAQRKLLFKQIHEDNAKSA